MQPTRPPCDKIRTFVLVVFAYLNAHHLPIYLYLPTSTCLFLSSLTIYSSFYSFSFSLLYLFLLKTRFIIFFYSIILTLNFSIFSI